MTALYYCIQENNTCSKKEECKRYIQAENNNKSTLFKQACTEENDYILFIKQENQGENE